MIDGENVFDQPVKNNEITCKNIRKITSDEGDDYATNSFIRLWLLQR